VRSQYRQTTTELAKQLMHLDVLIVDENSNDLKYYAELFETLGSRVFRCDSYQATVYSILRGRTFDLAVVDQGSAAFEGWVVLRYLRPFTPFVVLTRNHCMECYLEAMGLGAVDYLEKPVSVAEINRVLRGCLRSLANRGTKSQSGDAA
jgi:DNA-binding response OmpR family regulator